MKLELGMTAKDKITGFQGILVAKTEWLTGCIRWGVEPTSLKDSKPISVEWFDSDRIEVIDKKNYLEISKKTKSPIGIATPGGPQNDPSSSRSGE